MGSGYDFTEHMSGWIFWEKIYLVLKSTEVLFTGLIDAKASLQITVQLQKLTMTQFTDANMRHLVEF